MVSEISFDAPTRNMHHYMLIGRSDSKKDVPYLFPDSVKEIK